MIKIAIKQFKHRGGGLYNFTVIIDVGVDRKGFEWFSLPVTIIEETRMYLHSSVNQLPFRRLTIVFSVYIRLFYFPGSLSSIFQA